MIRCVACGRLLRRAAATIPAVESGPTPHPAGALGPVCARKAGLIAPSLFIRQRPARPDRAVVRIKPRALQPQAELAL